MRCVSVWSDRTGASSLEYALLAATAVFAIALGAASIAPGAVERLARQASAAAQHGEAPTVSARGGAEMR
jgi:Flp pilus assembly pilin Flp